MDAPDFDLDHLAARLEPVIATLHQEGGAFAELVGGELSKKATSSLAGAVFGAVQSLGVAAWKAVRSSQARKRFEKRWHATTVSSERQQALRQFLAEDPKCAQSLRGLLLRFDFLRAVAEHVEQLPNISLLDVARRLSDIYVPLRIEWLSDSNLAKHSSSSNESLLQDASRQNLLTTLLRTGSHLIEGVPGSGKSTLARWLVASEAHDILESHSVASLDQLRLPLLVTARSLLMAESDFSTALQRAVNAEMSVATLGSFPEQFFLPYSESGHKRWLVVVDGLDEVEDQHERQRLWNVLSRLHSQVGDAFRFIVFARPGAVRLTQVDSSFQRWRVCPLTQPDRKLIAQLYVGQDDKVQQFLAHVGLGGFTDLYSTPLFEAIAASVFARTGAVPETKSGLCEAFISALLEKSNISGVNRDAILVLLSRIASGGSLDASFDDHELSCLIPPRMPRLQVGEHLANIARKTGIVQIFGGKLSFVHEEFRSYFLASHLARMHKPGASVWKSIDPYCVGWTTVRYLCENWDLCGKDTSAAVNALFSFGEDGYTCAADVSGACATVSDKVVTRIIDRIFREMYSTGATAAGTDILTRLAARRSAVKKRLVDAVYYRQSFLAERLECAECLLNAGHLGEALKALEFIALRDQEYQGDRIRAAAMLIALGRGGVAQRVLLELAQSADELGMRAEAASILFKSDRSDANRQLAAELLQELSADEAEPFYDETIARLLSLGEKDLALPLIRGRAKPLPRGRFLSDLPRDQIAACKAIAAYHDRDEAITALKSLLSLRDISLRGKAEVLEALADIGVENDARILLREAVGEGPDYEGADWFLLEILGRFGLEEELRAVGRYLLRPNLGHRISRIDLKDIIERLRPFFDQSELADVVRARLRAAPDAHLAACLAAFGCREEVVGLLKSWLKSSSLDHRIDAAETLCLIGERQLGIRSLNQVVRDCTFGVETRLLAIRSLERVDEINAAVKAVLLLLRDPALSVEEQCQVVRYFDQEDTGRSDAIWEFMIPKLTKEDLPVRDRAAIAKVLLDLPEPEWYEFDHLDVIDELFLMLEASGIPVSDAWKVIDVLGAANVPFAEIPGAFVLVEDNSIPVGTRIKVLGTFVSRAEDLDAARKLIEISKTPGLSYGHVIGALSSAGIAEEYEALVQQLLRLIIDDSMVPPEWRLKAAQAVSRCGDKHGSNEGVVQIIRDASVATRVRLKALCNLEGASTDQRVALLQEVASTPEVDVWNRLAIADAALEVNATQVVEALLTLVLADSPHSIGEMTKIAQILCSTGRRQQAIAMLTRIVALSDLLLEETEDHSDTIAAAELLVELGHKDVAEHFLFRILDLLSWHDLKEVLGAIGRVGGESEARKAALRVLPRLVAEPSVASDMYMGPWRILFEEFLVQDWTNELAPLLVVSMDQSRLLIDRAEATAAIYRHSACNASQNWMGIAQSALTELSKQKELSVNERIGLVPVLNACGLEGLANRHIETLVKAADLGIEDRRALAGLLLELSDRKRAEEVLKGIEPSQEAEGFLGPWHERTIKNLQGEEHLRRIQEARTFDEQEPVVDRLFEARDLVSEYGDKRALDLIMETARDEQLEPTDRLDAIDMLGDLGYRDVPRKLLVEISEHQGVDEYWAGELLLRYGDKAGALDHFQRAIRTCPESYCDQIAHRLADLQAVDLLQELHEAMT